MFVPPVFSRALVGAFHRCAPSARVVGLHISNGNATGAHAPFSEDRRQRAWIIFQDSELFINSRLEDWEGHFSIGLSDHEFPCTREQSDSCKFISTGIPAAESGDPMILLSISAALAFPGPFPLCKVELVPSRVREVQLS